MPIGVYERKLVCVEDRFWSKVNKTPGCWIWTANKSPEGYGQFWLGGRLVPAHRWSYESENGAIPKGLVLDHRCRERGCVRPEHLDAVTESINIRRGIGPGGINAAKTKCVHGHPYSKENTITNKDGSRRCRTCKREMDRRNYYGLR